MQLVHPAAIALHVPLIYYTREYIYGCHFLPGFLREIKMGRLALPLHNAGRSFRQSPQNAAVSASVQTPKWEVTTRYSEKTNHLLTSGLVDRNRPSKVHELLSQVPGKTLFNYWIKNETYHNCMDHKTTHCYSKLRGTNLKRRYPQRFYMLPRTSSQT